MIVRLLGAFWGIVLLCSMVTARAAGDRDDNPTYYRDVAPLLQRSCVSCHSLHGSGPFSLATYADARRRAGQIAQVTQSGFMPPWQTTTPGFCGERHLTADEKSTLKRWADSGAPEGEKPNAVPAAPENTGWPLGPPDRIVTMPQAYTLAATTLETTRCFVLPNVVKENRNLRAVAFKPSNPRIVRYVCLYEDTTGEGRKQESISGAVGYFGFTGGLFPSPAGTVADWSPGATVLPYPTGVAVPLTKNADLILEVRFHPTGRSETEQMQVGLYYSADPSPMAPVTLRLGKAELYLPKNSTAKMTDNYTLPVDTQAVEIIPNAHFAAQKILVTATTPDGKSQSILDIPDWDGNWKQPYRFATPLALPAGTKLALTMTFNNTEENPRNPWKPSHRIVPGLEYMEEMNSVWLRLVPGSAADRAKLVAALPSPRHQPDIDIDEREPEGKPPPRPRPGPPGARPGPPPARP